MLVLCLTSTFPVARLSGLVNGTLLVTYAYDPYGNLTSSTGSVANPWRFAGGYFGSSTGLYKFRTRYYNPGFGRWPQQDPVRGKLSDPMTLNRYVYAGDDPVNLTDPSGRAAKEFYGDCGRGVIALTSGVFLDAYFALVLYTDSPIVSIIGTISWTGSAVPESIPLNRLNPLLRNPFGWEEYLPTGLGEITVTVAAIVFLANGDLCVLDVSITENIQ